MTTRTDIPSCRCAGEAALRRPAFWHAVALEITSGHFGSARKMRLSPRGERAKGDRSLVPQQREFAMWRWTQENPNLWSACAFLVGSVIFALATVHDWQTSYQYLLDGLVALVFLANGLKQLWRWRQQRLRM